MEWPSVEPWTELADDGFLKDVLAARGRHGTLVGRSLGDIERAIAPLLPVNLRWVHHGPPPPEATSKVTLRRITYSAVVHNRPDVLADPRRITRICHSLLNEPYVDEWADAQLVPIQGTDDFWVIEGNHRLVAQHVLGIHPWAKVHR